MHEDIQEFEHSSALGETPPEEQIPPTQREAETVADPGVSQNDGTQATAEPSDPDLAGRSLDTGTVSPDLAEFSRLREELRQLRDEVARKEAISWRLGKECAEFRDLYPDTPLSEIPDTVWDTVAQGIPLAAAFALSERKRERLETVAKDRNDQNRTRASGALSQETPGYFSFEEVKRMNRAQVREHYDNILRSMPKWH